MVVNTQPHNWRFEMQVQNKKLSDIVMAPFNPKSRTDRNNLKGLRRSIEEIGLLYPVLVDSNNKLIDGHRRVAVAKLIGWTEIPALIVAKDTDHCTAYAQVNASQRKQTGNEALHIYLADPNALTTVVRARMIAYEELFGKELLKKVAKLGLSLTTFRTANRILAYCDWDEDQAVACAEWCIKHGTFSVNEAINTQSIEPSRLRAAVERDKPIKAQFGIDTRKRPTNKRVVEA